MKAISMGLALLLVGGTAYAASVLRVSEKWAEVQSKSQSTEVYRLYDAEHGVMCYYSYIKKNANTPPVVSCVKVR